MLGAGTFIGQAVIVAGLLFLLLIAVGVVNAVQGRHGSDRSRGSGGASDSQSEYDRRPPSTPSP